MRTKDLTPKRLSQASKMLMIAQAVSRKPSAIKSKRKRITWIWSSSIKETSSLLRKKLKTLPQNKSFNNLIQENSTTIGLMMTEIVKGLCSTPMITLICPTCAVLI